MVTSCAEHALRIVNISKVKVDVGVNRVSIEKGEKKSEDYHYFKAILARHSIGITRKRVLPELEAMRQPDGRGKRIRQLVSGVQSVLRA